MIAWSTAAPAISAAFLASLVEVVEAFTIVLAVSLSIGWRAATGAALAAFAALAAMTVATGGVLSAGLDITWLQLIIGVFLLLFGVRWLAKAVARGAGFTPNAVTDADMAELRRHFDDEQIVEIVAVIANFGFLNRWNDTMATELEQAPLAWAGQHLAPQGWEPGKHAPVAATDPDA